MECNHLASVSDLGRCWWCWCSGCCARFGPVRPVLLSLLVTINRFLKKWAVGDYKDASQLL